MRQPPTALNRAWLLDQLRFYKVQLRQRHLHRMAYQAHEMADYVLDHGMAWPDCVPSVRVFIREADQVLQGRRTLPRCR